MKARQIHFAGRNQKMTVDQVNDSVRQVGREVRAIVGAAIFSEPARDIYSREALSQRQLYIGISLIVAQQDVETRLPLLDEVIFKRERLFVICNDDIVNVHRLADQGSSLGILHPAFMKVGANAAAKVLGLAHINNLALGVLVQIN